MALENWSVRQVQRNEITDFVEQWHYSGSINGCIADFCYALFDESGSMKGAMFYGRMAMRNQYKRFADKESDVIELRRLCCIDDTPKNTESYFIGKTIKWLRKNTDYKCIVSYADPFHGHGGIIYKATNFEHLGMSSPGKVILWGDKTYHDKTIRDYNRAHYKKTGERIPAAIATRLKQALESGDAKLVDTPGKHIYFYPLTKECRKLTLKLVTSKSPLYYTDTH